MTISLESVPIPGEDTAPPTLGDNPNGWYDPDYPHSTAEHPYGYFLDKDGNADFSRPRKNRPRGTGTSKSTGATTARRGAASDRSARAAASLLAKFNNILGLGLLTFGMFESAEQLKTANEQFEEMAYGALVDDPDLCKKILSAGASSAKSQLIMAYAMLGVAVAPAAVADVKKKRELMLIEGEVSEDHSQ